MSNTITDLTGTTWEINSTTIQNWQTPSMNYNFSINGTVLIDNDFYTNFSFDFIEFGITNNGSRPWYNEVFFGSGNDDLFIVNSGGIDYDYFPLTLSIINGTDTTNADLIGWLQANATQQQSTTTYNITTTLTNLTASGDSTIDSDGTASVTLSANSGYTLPSSITVTNAQYTYDSSTGVISLSNATADVTISASGVKITISSFNELEVIDHTDYITLTIQGNTINVAKLIYDYVFLNGNLTINNAPYTFTGGVLEI